MFEYLFVTVSFVINKDVCYFESLNDELFVHTLEHISSLLKIVLFHSFDLTSINSVSLDSKFILLYFYFFHLI